jgi:hypothetical protein
MRAEIGQMTLDRTLAERAHLNANIVDAINGAAEDWGIRCLRYEIRKLGSSAFMFRMRTVLTTIVFQVTFTHPAKWLNLCISKFQPSVLREHKF